MLGDPLKFLKCTHTLEWLSVFPFYFISIDCLTVHHENFEEHFTPLIFKGMWTWEKNLSLQDMTTVHHNNMKSTEHNAVHWVTTLGLFIMPALWWKPDLMQNNVIYDWMTVTPASYVTFFIQHKLIISIETINILSLDVIKIQHFSNKIT